MRKVDRAILRFFRREPVLAWAISFLVDLAVINAVYYCTGGWQETVHLWLTSFLISLCASAFMTLHILSNKWDDGTEEDN